MIAVQNQSGVLCVKARPESQNVFFFCINLDFIFFGTVVNAAILILELHFSFRVTHKRIGKTQFNCNAESKWCPPCQNKTRISGSMCIFNGTLFHISDIRVRLKRSVDLQNGSILTLPLRIIDQRVARNQSRVS